MYVHVPYKVTMIHKMIIGLQDIKYRKAGGGLFKVIESPLQRFVYRNGLSEWDNRFGHILEASASVTLWRST